MDIQKYSPWNWFKKEENQLFPSLIKESAFDFYSPMGRLHKEIDRLFDDVIKSAGFSPLSERNSLTGAGLSVFRPNLDIIEKPDEYCVTIEVPGVDEKDIKISVDGNLMSIKGEKKQEKEEKSENYHRVERSYGAFQRTLALPDDANVENVNAAFKSGILTVRIARSPERKSKVKTIEVKKE